MNKTIISLFLHPLPDTPGQEVLAGGGYKFETGFLKIDPSYYLRPGQRGNITVLPEEFLRTAFLKLPQDASIGLITPLIEERMEDLIDYQVPLRRDCLDGCDTFARCATFYGDIEPFADGKDNFAALHFVHLCQLGGEIPFERLNGLQPSWLLETEPGVFDGGFILAEPITDYAVAKRLIQAISKAGFVGSFWDGPWTWALLPITPQVSLCIDPPYECRLVEWEPSRQYSVLEIVEHLQLDLGLSLQGRTDAIEA